MQAGSNPVAAADLVANSKAHTGLLRLPGLLEEVPLAMAQRRGENDIDRHRLSY